jgi:hypothetical protein
MGGNGDAVPVFPGRAAASDKDSWRWVNSTWVANQERGVYSVPAYVHNNNGGAYA